MSPLNMWNAFHNLTSQVSGGGVERRRLKAEVQSGDPHGNNTNVYAGAAGGAAMMCQLSRRSQFCLEAGKFRTEKRNHVVT